MRRGKREGGKLRGGGGCEDNQCSRQYSRQCSSGAGNGGPFSSGRRPNIPHATRRAPRRLHRGPTGDLAPGSCRRSRTQASAAVPRRASQLPRKPPWLRAPRCSAGSTAPDAATTPPESPPAVPARLLPAAARKVGENSTCGAQLGQQELTGPKSLRWTRKRAKWGALPSSRPWWILPTP